MFFCLIEVLFRSKLNVGHFLDRDFYLANLEKAFHSLTFVSGNYNGGKRHDVIADHSPCCTPNIDNTHSKNLLDLEYDLLSTIFKLV